MKNSLLVIFDTIPCTIYSPYIFSAGAVASITPHGVKALRAILNDSVLDIMFYVSPRFGPEVSSCHHLINYYTNTI